MRSNQSIIDNLTESAVRQGNETLLNKLSDKKFINSLHDVIDTFRALGFHISESEEESNDAERSIYLEIAKTLVQNYSTIYYINVESGYYVGYSSSSGYQTLKIEEKGTTFFSDVVKNIPSSIHPDDQALLYNAMKKENILRETEESKVFKLNYRLMIQNKPTYVTLNAMRFASDNNLIIGITDIDDMTQKEMDYKKTIEKNVTYTNIALALAQNYFVIYYVNTVTDRYYEYSLDPEQQQLKKVSEGDDFFGVSIINARKVLVKEDQEKFLAAIKKETLLKEISGGKALNQSYRQIFNGKPSYVSLKAVNLIKDETHIVIAVSNVDAQKKREREYNLKLEEEKRLARTDGLTGAFNRYSYIELEEMLNSKIKSGAKLEFSVVVCDLNDLKKINDTYGHSAGDIFIRDAKDLISATFKDSSIFRTGGDEFSLIIEGSDYYKRDLLIKQIAESNLKNIKEGKVVVACGYSDFNSKVDKSVAEVFERADNLMYENKSYLKSLQENK